MRGAFAINNRFNYRCTAAKNRGETVCTNGHSVQRKAVKRAVLAALTTHLYTAENLAALVEEIRTLLQERARQHGADTSTRDHARAERLRVLDTEIANLEAALLHGNATAHITSMIEAWVKERESLSRQRDDSDQDPEALAARLASVLERLPSIVAAAAADLETLLAADHLDRGRDVIRALVTDIRLRPIPSNG